MREERGGFRGGRGYGHEQVRHTVERGEISYLTKHMGVDVVEGRLAYWVRIAEALGLVVQ